MTAIQRVILFSWHHRWTLIDYALQDHWDRARALWYACCVRFIFVDSPRARP